MKKNKINQKLENLERALSRFNIALKAPLDANELMIEASIQCFEFSYELAWKVLKDILEDNGIIANSPREIFKEAYSANFISEEMTWLSMLNDRNMTSHVYNKKIAKEIYERLNDYYTVMKKLSENSTQS